MNPSPHETAPVALSLPGRRTFMGWVTYALTALATLALAIPFVGYILGTRKRGVKWVSLGAVSSFPANETRMVTFSNPLRQPWDGMTSETGVYVRYQGKGPQKEEQFSVFAVNCAHLGCPVSWFPQSGLFMCPCHGGVYYADGERASGPPPRGLFHCAWRIREGNLEVQAPHYPSLQDTLDGKTKTG
jgi:Rieske Fe-S protein